MPKLQIPNLKWNKRSTGYSSGLRFKNESVGLACNILMSGYTCICFTSEYLEYNAQDLNCNLNTAKDKLRRIMVQYFENKYN
jgi:hypothetical protein